MDKHSQNIDFQKAQKAGEHRRILSKVVLYFLLTLWALIVLFPFYWMVLTSFKSYASYNAEVLPTFFSLSPTWENYVNAFTAVPLGRYLLNTLIFTLATTAIMNCCDHAGGLCLCQTPFSRKECAIHAVSVSDDDSHRIGHDYQLCHDHQPGAAQYVLGADPSVRHERLLYLSAQRELRAGAG